MAAVDLALDILILFSAVLYGTNGMLSHSASAN